VTIPDRRCDPIQSMLFRPPYPRVVLVACLLLTLCFDLSSASGFSAPESKQEKPYALIFGTVWGPDNRPVYGIHIKIRRASERKARWELYSDHSGEFAQRVPAGRQDYLVWADLKGYKLPSGSKLQAGTEVPVHIENDERTDIGLHLK
jgi:hypothetical protein